MLCRFSKYIYLFSNVPGTSRALDNQVDKVSELTTKLYNMWESIFNRFPMPYKRVKTPGDIENSDGPFWAVGASIQSSNLIGLSSNQQTKARALIHAVRKKMQRTIKVLILHSGVDGFSTNKDTWKYLENEFGTGVSFALTAVCSRDLQEAYPSVFTTRENFAWTYQDLKMLNKVFQPGLNDNDMLATYPSPTRWSHWLHNYFQYKTYISVRARTLLNPFIAKSQFLGRLESIKRNRILNDYEPDSTTTKKCANCGSEETDSRWVRDPSSPSAVRCGNCEFLIPPRIELEEELWSTKEAMAKSERRKILDLYGCAVPGCITPVKYGPWTCKNQKPIWMCMTHPRSLGKEKPATFQEAKKRKLKEASEGRKRRKLHPKSKANKRELKKASEDRERRRKPNPKSNMPRRHFSGLHEEAESETHWQCCVCSCTRNKSQNKFIYWWPGGSDDPPWKICYACKSKGLPEEPGQYECLGRGCLEMSLPGLPDRLSACQAHRENVKYCEFEKAWTYCTRWSTRPDKESMVSFEKGEHPPEGPWYCARCLCVRRRPGKAADDNENQKKDDKNRDDDEESNNDDESNDDESNDDESNDDESNDDESNDDESNDDESNDDESNGDERNDDENDDENESCLIEGKASRYYV
jgi:hypothetical protein